MRRRKVQMEPLRRKPDYGDAGNKPQDFMDDELVELASRLTAVAGHIFDEHQSSIGVRVGRKTTSSARSTSAVGGR